jgi:predicted amidohydrolase
MPVRALENRVFTVTANRIGSENRMNGDELTFTGNSRICAPNGDVLAEGSQKGEEIIEVIIDPAQAEDKKVTPHNDLLKDRKPGFYR